MFRVVSYLLLAGAAAYASQPYCPCASTSVRRTTTVRRVRANSGAADRTYTTTDRETRTWWLPAGTRIPVRLDQSLDTKHDPIGAPFVATVSAPVMRGGELIIPRGAVARGHVMESKASGRLKGRAHLGLVLDTVSFRGRVYNLPASGPVFVSKNHKKHDAVWIGGGAATGAGIGALAGGGVGAAVGAGAGAVVGTTGAVITGRKQVRLAPETPMVFTMRRPVEIREVEYRASR